MGGYLVKCLLDILFKQNFVPSKADVPPRTTAITLAMLEINGCLIPKASRTCGSSTIRKVNTMEPMTEKISVRCGGTLKMLCLRERRLSAITSSPRIMRKNTSVLPRSISGALKNT